MTMIQISKELLYASCLGNYDRTRVLEFVEPVRAAMSEFAILDRLPIAAFLATVAHESWNYAYTKELSDGSRYEGRVDLGNTAPGDGVAHFGVGLIQVTGKHNWDAAAKFFGMGRAQFGDWAQGNEGAARSAAWYFTIYRPRGDRGGTCVDEAEKGNFVRVCELVGGQHPNGMKSRLQRYSNVLRYIDR